MHRKTVNLTSVGNTSKSLHVVSTKGSPNLSMCEIQRRHSPIELQTKISQIYSKSDISRFILFILKHLCSEPRYIEFNMENWSSLVAEPNNHKYSVAESSLKRYRYTYLVTVAKWGKIDYLHWNQSLLNSRIRKRLALIELICDIVRFTIELKILWKFEPNP